MEEPHVRFRLENVCVSMYGRTTYENTINLRIQISMVAPRNTHKNQSLMLEDESPKDPSSLSD